MGLVLILLSSCQTRTDMEINAKLVRPPVATRQLGPAVFLPKTILRDLQIKEGWPLRVASGSASMELRAYLLPDSGKVFSMHKEYSKKLGLKPGSNRIVLKRLSREQAHLSPRPLRVYAENYRGNTEKWSRIAYGAPHGDCDMETGNIVKQMTETYGIPSTAGYGARLSYRGKWFDMNRPLMKLPKPGGGTFPDRVWNAQSEAVYHMYQDSVWRNNGMHFGQRFDLFCSFHGHDLTVRLKDGTRIERPVMEAMGVGFTKNELRKIKAFYNRSKTNYYAHPPMLVFGNLPEDRTYYYQGIPLTFFYSGLGTRVYGSLRGDLVKHALHIETPNTMRLDKTVQPKTAQFLFDLYTFITDSILSAPKENSRKIPGNTKPKGYGKMVAVPAGAFPMGTDNTSCWSSERPAHQTYVSAFKIDRYEVSNEQYASFLNRAFKAHKIMVQHGVVKSTEDSSHILCRTVLAAPMSQLTFKQGIFSALAGKEYFPVIYVSYYGAQRYAAFNGKRLPTEAEWEKAAGWDAQRHKKYMFAYRSDRVQENKANFEDSGDPFEWGEHAFTTPVGWYRAQSPAGVYDMSGNVLEWCADFYDYNRYKKQKGEVKNPKGPAQGTMRTVRGGAWNLEPWISRTTFRLGIHPNMTLVNVGFRCVKTEN